MCLLVALLAGATVVCGQSEPTPEGSNEKPFHDFRQQQLEYSGPETEPTLAESLDDIALGWFGPSDPHDSSHGDLWTAASIAVDQANAEGGLDGVPFRLVPRWSENVWGTGVAQVARMAYDDQVWAILGSVDGAATHLAEQIVAKARLPLVSPVATDESINLAGVPWMFSVIPGDHLWAPPLARALVDSVGQLPFTLVTFTDHDSRLAADTLTESLAALGRGPAMRLDLAPGGNVSPEDLDRLDLGISAALLLVASPADGASLLRAVRERGYNGPIYATPQATRRQALERAGEAAGNVFAPRLLASPPDSEQQAFAESFRELTGAEPDWAVLHTYDATRLLLEAVRLAGPSRAGIRQSLLELSPWQGVTGVIEWDPTGQNARRVATIAPILAR